MILEQPVARVALPRWSQVPTEEVVRGLRATGFDARTRHGIKGNPQPRDLLVTWSIWGGGKRAALAHQYGAAGARIFVMENGFLPRVHGQLHTQLAEKVGNGSGFNGGGVSPTVDDPTRWASWGIELQPAHGGRYILVCAQRGTVEINPEITYCAGWVDVAMAKIRAPNDMPVLWRPHPGSSRMCLPRLGWGDVVIGDPAVTSLEEHLAGASCCVVYSSSSATAALIAGVPVFHDGHSIITRDCAVRLDDADFERPEIGDRKRMFERIAWLQYSHRELEQAGPWRRLVSQSTHA